MELPVEFEVAVEGMDVNQILCEVRIACANWLHMHQKVKYSQISQWQPIILNLI